MHTVVYPTAQVEAAALRLYRANPGLYMPPWKERDGDTVDGRIRPVAHVRTVVAALNARGKM